MFTPMLFADPDLQPYWDRFVQEWEGQELPQYLLLAEVADYLIGKLASGQTQRFDAVFDVVELWQTHGDSYVAEATVIG